MSGFIGGWLDKLLVFVMDALYSFPSLLLAIVFAFLLRDKVGGGVVSAALSLTAIYIPQYFRVVRNTTVSAREATYVEAARAIGAGPFTIMRKYLFSNVVQSVPVIATLNAADALGTLAALGFLGLGIQPTEAAEWGYDIQVGLSYAQGGVWWPSFFPAMAIILLITALTFVGEGLNETVNPALRRRRLQDGHVPGAPAAGTDRRGEDARELRPDRRHRPAATDGRPRARGRRPAGLVRRPDGPGARRRRRDLLAAPGEILGLVGESGLRQVDPRPRPARAAARRRRPATARCASAARTCSSLRTQGAVRSCAAASSG